MDDRARFEAAWPAIHKHGISGGWEAIGWAAWQEAKKQEREDIFEEVCKMGDADFMKWYAGKMSAQDLEASKAVEAAIRESIRLRAAAALKAIDKAKEPRDQQKEKS